MPLSTFHASAPSQIAVTNQQEKLVNFLANFGVLITVI